MHGGSSTCLLELLPFNAMPRPDSNHTVEKYWGSQYSHYASDTVAAGTLEIANVQPLVVYHLDV